MGKRKRFKKKTYAKTALGKRENAAAGKMIQKVCANCQRTAVWTYPSKTPYCDPCKRRITELRNKISRPN